MAESLVAVSQGSGKNFHTYNRTIGGNSVEDEVVLIGEQYVPTYVVAAGATISIATAASHVLQIMAGTTNPVFIRRIKIWKSVPATTAALIFFQLLRLTTAGTGGGTITPQQHDSTNDSAAGATAMTLPTVKGTEGAAVGSAVGM